MIRHGTPNGWGNITSSSQMENMLHVKVPGALRIKKLRTLPDQTYIDCPNVRTKDDAVITLRFMVFYHLCDIKMMIDATNDPISDFVNSCMFYYFCKIKIFNLDKFISNC